MQRPAERALKRIAVLEADVILRRLLACAIEWAGFESVVSDGGPRTRAAPPGDIDAAVVDLDGWSVAALPDWLPVALLTSDPDDVQSDRFWHCAIVRKPLQLEEIRMALGSLEM